MPGIDDARDRGDDASLGDLLLGLLRFYRDFGRLLMPLALLCAVAAGTLAALRPVYGVTALLETPQMSLERWRKLQPMLSDRRLVAESLAASALPPAQRERLQQLFLQPRFWETQVKYRATVERDDIRQQVNIDPKSVGVLGLEVSVNARDDVSAAQQLQAVAAHLRQVTLWDGLRDYLDGLRQQARERRPQLQIAQIDQQFNIEQNTRQVAEMQQLLDRYPELRGNAVNTVVSVGDGGGKYLSPLAQIVALQATITEIRATQRQGQRELELLDWRQRYLDRVDPRAPALRSGTALADWLQDQRTRLFAADAGAAPAQRQVAREIELGVSQLRWQAQLIRYKGLPALPAAPVPSRRPLLVAVAAFAGSLVLGSLLLALYATVRRMGAPQGQWVAARDPLFAWLPARLRGWLLGAHGGTAGPARG